MKLCCGWGWKKSTAPMASAALNSGRNFGSSQFSPFTTVSSSAPFRPSTVTARSSSSTAALTSWAGSVARPAKRWGQVVAEERRVDGDHLHVHALRVHVFQPLFRREAHLRRGEVRALAASYQCADAVAGFVTKAVPIPSGVGGPPQGPRHEMSVDVDGPHERAYFLKRLPNPRRMSPGRVESGEASRSTVTRSENEAHSFRAFLSATRS